jgi:hypothetical protein
MRGHPYLYERVCTGTSQTNGQLLFKDRHLGRVDDRVARTWEERGDSLLPPPLAGAKVPAITAERVPPPLAAPTLPAIAAEASPPRGGPGNHFA